MIPLLAVDAETTNALRDAPGLPEDAKLVPTPSQERLLATLETHGDRVDAVVVGPDAEHPVDTVQRIHARARDLGVLVLTHAGHHQATAAALRFAPFLSGEVVCRPAFPPPTADLARLVEGTRKRRRHRAAVTTINKRLRLPGALQRDAADHLDHLLLHVPVGVLLLDDAHRIVVANPRALQLLDLDAADARGTAVGDAFPPPDAQRLERLMRSEANKKPAASVTLERAPSDGRRVFLEATVAPYDDPSTAARTLLTLQDVTLPVLAAREIHRKGREFEALAENAPDAIARFDRTLRCAYANPAMERLTGTPRAELMGARLNDLDLPPSVARQWESVVREVLATREETAMEFRVPAPDGDRHYHARLVPEAPDGGGGPRHVLAITRDVTERVRALEALRESDARYRTLTDDVLDTSEVGTFVLDADFRVVWINQATERYFGIQRDEVLGADKRALIRDHIKHIFEDPDAFEARVLSTYDDNSRTERFECHALPGPGREERWLQHWSQPITEGMYAGGRIEHYTDITTQRHARNEIERAHAKVEGILESITDAFVAVDRDWCFTYVNKQAEEVLQRDADALLGSNLWKEFPAAVGRRFERENRRAMEERRPVIYEDYYAALDTWFEVRAYPSDGGLSIYFRDITGERRTQEELEAARRELEATAKLATMGTLVSGVAHEIRTPLTYIGNNAFLIRHALQKVADAHPEVAEDAERIAGFADEVQDGVERANRLVNDLREFTKRKLGERAPARLDEVVGEAVRIFNQTHGGDVQVAADLQPTPPLELDRLQVQQVVLNLLENASDAAGSGGTVRVRTEPGEGGAGGRLVVRDDGPGMPDDVLKRVFDPFYTTKDEGTGLGLAIVKRIVSVHGGTVDVDTAPGEGATFTVTLSGNGHGNGDRGDG